VKKTQPSVYILASDKNGTLYIGVTSNLIQRIWQHKSNLVDGFTKKYSIHLLVYFERHASMRSAILREKQLKEWQRSWKIRLIQSLNPNWRDLYDEISDGSRPKARRDD
jgi:putative endonuclease